MLKEQSIHKRKGKTAANNKVTYQVNSGEIVDLIGENGAVKTTLLHIIATLQRATSGSVFLQDIAYKNKLKTVRKKIGFVPQEIAVWEDLTVEENMFFFEKL